MSSLPYQQAEVEASAQAVHNQPPPTQFSAPSTLKIPSSCTRLSKGIAGFLTGYVVSKIDPVFQLLVEKTGGQLLILNPRLVRTLMMSIACFMVSTIWVFVARIYWQGYE